MTITDLEAIPIEVRFSPRSEDGGLGSYARQDSSRSVQPRVLLRLETDDGVTGWGEMLPTMGSVDVVRSVFEKLIAPYVVGREVWEIEAFLQAIDRNSFTLAYYNANVQTFVAGVEMAMWDAWGKHLGEPVHRLLGGKYIDEVPFAFALGVVDIEESRRIARQAAENGFEVLKTKAGRDWRFDVERIRAMHDAVDGELEFRLDPNQGYSFEDAVRVGARLEDAEIYLQYLEQPVRVDSFGTLKRLRQRLTTPIAVNEDLYYPHNMLHLAREDAVDVGVVELLSMGGILRLKRQVGVASALGISLSHHSGRDLGIKTAAILQTVATTPAIALPPDTVYYAWADAVIESPFEFDDGRLSVPDDPGLGVTVDTEAIERHRVEEYRSEPTADPE
ncbi:mandelate racemase/muconate lactonizing enzyme family protein [Halococcus hamelinensis]|uniref:N-acylamino acid racemase n=1 Tax=Halococcus hamelinensis 100A6 TaxID=1132509 RepID=M0LXI6_9EURY|nr:mandelate racemase/muconate lactonizing enzyme family protein [Halococcus hamelinensis]EMA38161.1 N-acylamino acid racemase [Halococcus hamelinensis 100A6]